MRWHSYPDRRLLGDLEEMGCFAYNEDSGGHYDISEDTLERDDEQRRAEMDRFERTGSRRVKASRVRG